MRRGEIWWTDVPGLGRRPALVLTRDMAIPVLSRVLVALLTTNVRGIPSEVVVEDENGLPRPSVVSLDNILTVPKAALRRNICLLSASRMDEVCAALHFAAGC